MRVEFSKFSRDSVESEDLEVFWENFLETLDASMEKYIPKVRPSNRAKKKTGLSGRHLR